MGPHDASGTWLGFHNLRASGVVWVGGAWHVHRALRLLKDCGALGHRLVAPGWEARDRVAVVAPLHRATLLLALLRRAHRHRGLVRLHELHRALDHVRLLCSDGDKVPQEGCAVRNLHHAAAASADARGYVCHSEGCAVPGSWGGVPREYDKLDSRPDDVRQLLCALLQVVRGQLLL